jgi:hypothetical protein
MEKSPINNDISNESFLVPEAVNENVLDTSLTESVRQYWNALLAIMPKNFYKHQYIDIRFYGAGENHSSVNVLRMCADYGDMVGIQDEIAFGTENERGQLNFEVEKATRKFKKAPSDLGQYSKRMVSIANELVKQKGSQIMVAGFGISLYSNGSQWVTKDEYEGKKLDAGQQEIEQ